MTVTLKSLTQLASIAVFSLSLAGCSPIVRTHGNLVEDDRLAEITLGVSRQADVVSVLGTPSAEGTFNPNEWYYIGQQTEQVAFFAPDVVKREVVKVTFDRDTGSVAAIEKVDPDKMADITPVSRTTPSAGHNLTFMEQVLGNIGRFNKPSSN